MSLHYDLSFASSAASNKNAAFFEHSRRASSCLGSNDHLGFGPSCYQGSSGSQEKVSGANSAELTIVIRRGGLQKVGWGLSASRYLAHRMRKLAAPARSKNSAPSRLPLCEVRDWVKTQYYTGSEEMTFPLRSNLTPDHPGVLMTPAGD